MTHNNDTTFSNRLIDIFRESFKQLCSWRIVFIVLQCSLIAAILNVVLVLLLFQSFVFASAFLGGKLPLFGSSLLSQWTTSEQFGLQLSALLILSSYLFPPLMLFLTSLFSDQVCDHIESKYHPEKQKGRSLSTWHYLYYGSRLAALTTLLLPIVFLLSCIPPLSHIPHFFLVSYTAMNAYLIGREYFMMIGLRYERWVLVKELYLNYRSLVLSFGLFLALLIKLPFLNLLLPILSNIIMINLYYNLKESDHAKTLKQSHTEDLSQQ